jgi:hypothetical protein
MSPRFCAEVSFCAEPAQELQLASDNAAAYNVLCVANTPTPRDVAQLGRAPALGAGSRQFESGHPDSKTFSLRGKISVCPHKYLVCHIEPLRCALGIFCNFEERNGKQNAQLFKILLQNRLATTPSCVSLRATKSGQNSQDHSQTGSIALCDLSI